MEKINLITIVQINFHLEKGESIFFDFKNGWGFLKMRNEDNASLYDGVGIDFAVQTNNDEIYIYESPKRKEAYVEIIKKTITCWYRVLYYSWSES